MLVSEAIWNCLESIHVTKILYDNPRPRSHSFTSYFIQIFEIFVNIQKSIRNCHLIYSTFVLKYYPPFKSQLTARRAMRFYYPYHNLYTST